MNLLFSGHPSEARTDLLLAVQLDPDKAGFPLIQIGMSYYFEHDYVRAVEVLRGIISNYTSNPLPYRWLAASLGQLDRTEDARQALDVARTSWPDSFQRYTEKRAPWFRPEDFEHMLDGVQKAGWEG